MAMSDKADGKRDVNSVTYPNERETIAMHQCINGGL